MKKYKSCPANKFLDCEKETCGWWVEEEGCAIKAIAKGIKGLLMAILKGK